MRTIVRVPLMGIGDERREYAVEVARIQDEPVVQVRAACGSDPVLGHRVRPRRPEGRSYDFHSLAPEDRVEAHPGVVRRRGAPSPRPVPEPPMRALKGIKGRYTPMRRCGNVPSAACFRVAYDKPRDYFRSRMMMNQPPPLSTQRKPFQTRLAEPRARPAAASQRIRAGHERSCAGWRRSDRSARSN